MPPGPASVLALQRAAGNAAVSRLLDRRPPARTLQRKWVFLPDLGRSDRTRDRYYWQGAAPEPEVKPGVVRRFKLEKADPAQLSGSELKWGEAQYLTYVGSASTARKDVYSPFGRFSEDVSKTAFLPFVGVTRPDELGGDEHEEIDVDQISVECVSGGIPATVVTKQGSKLNAMAVIPPWGVMYGDGPLMPSSGGPKRSERARLPAGVPPNIKVALDQLGRSVEAQHIDKSALSGYQGSRKEDVGQGKVMGVSAAAVAQAAGYDEAIDPEFALDQSPSGRKKRGWEWLHLVAYELGGPSATGPQVPANLVVGTTAANTSMLMIEDAIVNVIRGGLAESADVVVLAVMADEQYRVAETIHYQVRFTLPDKRRADIPVISFSALAVTTPYTAANRYFRQMLRHDLEQASQPADEATPMMF